MSAVLRVAGMAVAVGVLLRLSAWQWDRARSGESLRSYSYALEWGLLALALVVLVGLPRARRRPDDDGASRTVDGSLLGPPLAPGERLGEPTGSRVRRCLGRRTG